MSPDWLVVFGDLLASTSIRAAVLAAAVGATLALFRVPPGAIRHTAWAVVTTAMLVMPAVLPVVPAVEIPWPVLAVPARSPDAPALIEAAPGTAAGEATTAESAGQQQTVSVVASRTTPHAPVANAPAVLASRGLPWTRIALAAYGAGVLLFLTRLAIGWALVRRLLRTSRPCGERMAEGLRVELRETPRIATPLTVGLIRPAVLLPATWQSWPAEHLRAVLAHELAHARRQDPLVAFVAYVNRAIFWFHPLAWWLVGRLAAHAEDACDTAAMTTMETPRRYAEVLTAMAEAVRRHGRRVAWQGAGVDGADLLGSRIERILTGDLRRDVARSRKLMVAAACALTMATAVSCRPATPPPVPLQPNPEVSARRARYTASDAEFKATLAMTKAQVADLEAVLQQNPEDLETRKKLLTFYRSAGHKTVGWNETVAARRRHILWLIEHHPADRWLLQAGGINPAFDPDGYAKAKELWLAASAAKDVAPAVLGNAASFFRDYDWPLTEQFLLRARTADPGGPQPRIDGIIYSPPWAAALGSLYAHALLAVAHRERTAEGTARTATDAERAFAAKARAMLDGTTDAAVLTGAGSRLIETIVRQDSSAAGNSGFDPQALGVSYLERVIVLDPERASTARSQLWWLASIQRQRRIRAMLKDVPMGKQHELVRSLPDAERMVILPTFALSSYEQVSFHQDTQHDPKAAAEAVALARACAEDLLKLAESFPADPNRGTAIFSGHVVLGLLAVRDNEVKTALAHMESAGSAPPSDELRYGNSFAWQRLATALLKRGERESVARFLDRCAALSEVKGTREQMTKAAASIRAGRMPEFYQYQTTSR